MPAQPAKRRHISAGEIIEELEPHEKAIKFGIIVSAFLFVWFSVVYSSTVSATHLGNFTSTNIGTGNGWTTQLSDGNYDVNGAGTSTCEIWWSSDCFTYYWRNAPTGDFEMTTKIDSLTNTDPWAKAGIMIRASIAANSTYLFIFTTPGFNGVYLQGRNGTGQNSFNGGSVGLTAFPKYLRLKRAGGVLTAYASSNGVTFTKVGGDSTTPLGSSPLLGLAVTSHKGGVYATGQFRSVSLTTSGSEPFVPVPVGVPNESISPWTAVDIGNPLAGGQDGINTNSFDLYGDGSDIWGTSDSFRYAHQSRSGDLQLTAKVESLDNTDPWAKGGLMIRSTMATNSPYFFVFVTPGNGVAVQYRGAFGSYSGHHAQTSGNQIPKWLRITKYNNSYRAYISDDGQNFSPLGKPVLFPMNSNYLAGVAVTSHKSGTLNRAAFRNIALSNPPSALNPSVEFNVDYYTYTGPGGNAGTGIGWAANAFDCWAESSPDTNLWSGYRPDVGATVVYPTSASNFRITCYGGTQQVSTTRDTNIKPICGGGSSDGLKNGELYQGSGPEKWVIQNCQKRHIVSPEVFQNICMYDASKVKPTQDRYLNVIATGSSVSSGPCPSAPQVQPGGVKLKVPEVNSDGSGAFTKGFLEGAEVQLFKSNGTFVEKKTTGSDKTVEFKNLAPGTYKLYAKKSGYKGAWRQNGSGTGFGCVSGAQPVLGSAASIDQSGTNWAYDGNVNIAGGGITLCRDLGLAQIPQAVPGPVTGDPGKDAIMNYIKDYVGGWNVRRTIGGYDLNFGRFLWGLAGCESVWYPLAYNSGYYKEKGLYQYQAQNIAGYPNSLYDIWGSTVSEARSRGANVGDDIWNYQHQVQVTAWKVSHGGGDTPQAWSCWNGWFSGGRNWTWFTDEWPDPNF